MGQIFSKQMFDKRKNYLMTLTFMHDIGEGRKLEAGDHTPNVENGYLLYS